MLVEGCQPHSPKINEEVAISFFQSLTAHYKCFESSHYLLNYVFGGVSDFMKFCVTWSFFIGLDVFFLS